LKAIKRPANYKPYRGKSAELIATGKALFSDTKLSTNGLSCNTCHQNYGAYQPTFAKPYPHAVAMATEMGFKQVQADEMVQLCMVRPMAAKPLAWNSKELAALTAYVVDIQKGFKPTAASANPCAAKNPCGAKNPCAAKAPCGARNPCAAKNPCAAAKR
jgi:cytochrome c